jgi:hypothetical protein
MKLLSPHDKLEARPASAVAPFTESHGAPVEALSVRPRRQLHLTPNAALVALLAVVAVSLCEPSDAASWLKAIAAGVIVPGGVYAIVQTATGRWRLP